MMTTSQDEAPINWGSPRHQQSLKHVPPTQAQALKPNYANAFNVTDSMSLMSINGGDSPETFLKALNVPLKER